ncbi:MAG TPA: GNAT family N-acetyltransferase [Pseudorhodoplanes sp.]|jgi:GNAT superfamily N-acetyltransferase|nr:GNAT family N-acetyltransferase [Pseudorhodoplanes sp.]
MKEFAADGTQIRKLWMFENGAYRDHLLRLDRVSRQNRFGGAVSDDYIRSYARDTNHLDAVLYGFFVDGMLRGVAELRPIGGWRSGEAEAAFSVEKEWQSHGVGSALLEQILLAARNRGVKFLHMACLARNQRMQQLARKFDAKLRFDFDSVVGEVKASRPTPLSFVREAWSDACGFAVALLDAQTRLMKPR